MSWNFVFLRYYIYTDSSFLKILTYQFRITTVMVILMQLEESSHTLQGIVGALWRSHPQLGHCNNQNKVVKFLNIWRWLICLKLASKQDNMEFKLYYYDILREWWETLYIFLYIHGMVKNHMAFQISEKIKAIKTIIKETFFVLLSFCMNSTTMCLPSLRNCYFNLLLALKN